MFLSKNGVRLSQSMLSGYWGNVLARANLDFDFYLATKHYCVHYMYATLNLPQRVIAEQMGWTLAGVSKLLVVYGHGDVGPRRLTAPLRRTSDRAPSQLGCN